MKYAPQTSKVCGAYFIMEQADDVKGVGLTFLVPT